MNGARLIGSVIPLIYLAAALYLTARAAVRHLRRHTMAFHFTDIDGDELIIEPIGRHGRPAISLRTKRSDSGEGAAVHLSADQIEDVIARMRDTLRQADNPVVRESAQQTASRLGLGHQEQAAPVHWQAIARDRERELKAVGEQKHAIEAERDGAYRERAQLLAWLATLHAPHAVIAPSIDVDEEGWQLLFFTVAGRQLSWHIAPRDADLFEHVEHVEWSDPRAAWDGHTTDEKYQRIRTLPWGEMRDAVRTPGPAETAIDRVRAIKKSPKRSPYNTYTNAQDDGWDQALDAVLAALDEPTQEQA